MILVYLFASCMARTFFLFPIILFVSLLLITFTRQVDRLFMNVSECNTNIIRPKALVDISLSVQWRLRHTRD